MWLVFLMYALFASIFTVAKATLEYASPFFLIGSRMAVAGALIIAYQFFFNRSALQWRRSYWKSLLSVIVFNFYLTNIFEFWGMQFVTSSKACFIYNLSPFVSAFLMYFLFTEKLSRWKWLGLIVGFIGMLPILMSGDQSEDQLGSVLFFSWPEISLLFAVVCSAYGWISVRKLCDLKCSPLTVNGIGMFFAGILALIHSYVVEPWEPVPVSAWEPVLKGSLYMMIISNLLAYNLYSYLLKRFSVTFMSLAGSLTPLFAILFGTLFLGEPLTWSFFISLPVVLAGLYMFHLEEIKQRHPL